MHRRSHNLCDHKEWETATTADVRAELAGGADVMANERHCNTPLHFAARYGTSAEIHAPLATGADPNVSAKNGKTPWDLAQYN